MRNRNNDEPLDEFDRIMIPAFIARPFERLGSRPSPAAPAGERRATGPADDGMPADPDAPPIDDEEQPAPRAWWAGYRGKLLLYGVGTIVMVFLQSRG
jgi:hypothetical protein